MNTILFTTSPMTFDDSLHDHRPIHQKYHKALRNRRVLDFLLPKVHQLSPTVPDRFHIKRKHRADPRVGFLVRIKSGRTGEFSSVESIPTPCKDASKYSFEYDTTHYELYILYLFFRFTGFGISLAISSSRRLRQCGGQSSRCDRSSTTLWRNVVPESGQRNWSHCSELARGMGPQPGRVG